jgi:hypothetical protein
MHDTTTVWLEAPSRIKRDVMGHFTLDGVWFGVREDKIKDTPFISGISLKNIPLSGVTVVTTLVPISLLPPPSLPLLPS